MQYNVTNICENVCKIYVSKDEQIYCHVCVNIYIPYICVYVYIYIHTYNIYKYIFIFVYVYIYTHIYAYIVCVCVCVSVCVRDDLLLLCRKQGAQR